MSTTVCPLAARDTSGPFAVALSGMGTAVGAGLFQRKRTDNERIERRGPKRFDGIARRAHDRLPAGIERGIDQHGHTGAALESGDEVVIQRMLPAIDGLHASRAVNVA